MTSRSLRFQAFTLDLERLSLRGPGGQVDLRPKSYEVLRYLVEHAGRVVTKDEVMRAVWPDVTVGDESLTRCISEVRRAIADEGQAIIKTVPRRGYLFDAAVSSGADGGKDLVPSSQACASCGTTGAPSSRFCGACGASLVEAGPVPVEVAVRAREAVERRQVSVLVASTGVSARLDPEDLRELMLAYRARAAQIVGQAGGFVSQVLGDGIAAYFGYPEAHEDDAERAVRAGLELAAFAPQLKSAVSSLSIGIATGPVVVGDQLGLKEFSERVAVGDTPNLAAHLQSLARPGEVVVSASTRRLVGRLFICNPLGRAASRGAGDPIEAWRVLGEDTGIGRFDALRSGRLTPFVGREEEVGLLLRRWEQAKEGEGRVVLLSGEPGIGKSRIVETLVERMAPQPHARFSYFCSPHRTKSALYPFIAQLERAAGFEPGDTEAAKLAKLRALLAPTSNDVDRDIGLIGELLSLPGPGGRSADEDPQRRRELTLQALLNNLEHASQHSPALVVVEDAHWIDPTSLDLVDRAIGKASDLPVLVIVTFRPEFQPAWVGQPHVTANALSRLGRREGAQLLSAVVGGRALPKELADQILARTDGVPLFIEELTRALLEGSMVREEEGTLVLDGSRPPLAVPMTLQASLVARLDRLASTTKEVAQIGAAIGREFSYQLVHAVAAMGDAELGKSLDELVDSGLMHRRGSPPEATYIFKHALVQDAAYGTLVRRQRRQLHGRIASALIDRFPAVAQSEPEVVAYHSTEAGEAEQAIGYWLKAGEIASVRSANTEAVSHLRQGLALLRDRPSSAERDRQELEFQCTIGPNLIATHGYAAAETVAAYERARQLMGGDADISRLGTILTGLLVIYYNLAEHDKMLLVASEMLQAAEPRKDATSLCAAHQMIAATYNMRGEFKRANDHAESAWSHYDAKRHAPLAWRYAHDIGVAAKCQIGLSLWHLGFADRARAAFEVALAMAERLNHQNTLGYTLSYGGMFPAIFARDYEALGKHAAQAQQIGRDHKMPQWVAWGACLEAPALALRGQHHQARERLRLGLDLRRQLNNKCLDTLFFTGAALVEMFGDQNDRACSLIDDALANAERTGERWLDAELWCLRGDILMKKPRGGSNEEAGHCYRQATEIGRTQGSLMFQLRAATCLARLLIERGRRSEAERLLAPLYRTFSEGHGTTDLGDAKAVLDSLN